MRAAKVKEPPGGGGGGGGWDKILKEPPYGNQENTCGRAGWASRTGTKMLCSYGGKLDMREKENSMAGLAIFKRKSAGALAQRGLL